MAEPGHPPGNLVLHKEVPWQGGPTGLCEKKLQQSYNSSNFFLIIQIYRKLSQREKTFINLFPCFFYLKMALRKC
jgi:hypothetical protein